MIFAALSGPFPTRPSDRRRSLRTAATTAAASLALVVGVLAAAATTPFGPARAQDNVLRIAAVVNGDVISVLDLSSRLRLAALSAGVELDANTQQRLLPQVMRSMIDETLQRQAAEDASVRATDREVQEQLSKVAGRNNMSVEDMRRFFAQRGIDPDTLKRQVEAQILWAKYVQRQFGREARVTPEEVDEELDRLRAVADQPQHRVYEIFLAVDEPEREPEVKRNAERLLQQIRNGADFSSLARNFSQSPTAGDGGDLGWVAPGQLEPALDKALARLEPGMVSKPIRTVSGYYLLYVTDERTPGVDPMDTRIDLAQMTVRPPESGGEAARSDLIQSLTRRVSEIDGCPALADWAKQRDDASLARAEDVRLGDLPGPVREAVAPLDAGRVTKPVDRGGAIVVVGVCTREAPESELPSRDEVRNRLRTERLDRRAQRELRDLRRAAYIDVRL